MFTQQITCLHGQCNDPSCGFDFVWVGRQRIPTEAIIKNIDTGAGRYWTLVEGQGVSVVVGQDPATGARFVTTGDRAA
jgi:hypothetical protein